MTIEEMHYDFKNKLNKIDSQQSRNFYIPEIDWILNEAQEIFVKHSAFPRKKDFKGFEVSQRAIEDVRTLVKTNNTSALAESGDTYDYELPDDYWYFIKGDTTLKKSDIIKKAQIQIRQHDDQFQDSNFDKSSYSWGLINGVFLNEKTLRLYLDETLTKVTMTYIKRLNHLYNGANYNNKAGYQLLDRDVEKATENTNCELPPHTHREIVDIAVLLATNQLQSSDYQFKMDKTRINNM